MNPGRVGCATRPGHDPEWHFVVGAAFVAAVPARTAAAVEASLAALVPQAMVQLETVVSMLPMGGGHAVDTFAVVVPGQPVDTAADSAGRVPTDHTDGVPVSVVIRGAIAADIYSVGGSRRFTDRDIRPWLLADFQSVTGIVIGSPRFTALPPGEIHGGAIVDAGVTPGDTLFWSPMPSALVPAETEKRPGRHSAAAAADADADVDDTIVRSRGDIGDTVIRAPALPGDTILRSRGTARDEVRHPSGHTLSEPTLSEPTLSGTTLPGTTPSEPALPDPTSSEPTRQSENFPPYGFRISGGEERRLDSVFYLGRRPVAPRIPSGPPPTLLAVDSRTSAVSAMHLEIRQVGNTVVVTDLGSTNGTVVRTPLGRSERLRGGQSLTVTPGTTVDIGDGNIVEILPVGGR